MPVNDCFASGILSVAVQKYDYGKAKKAGEGL